MARMSVAPRPSRRIPSSTTLPAHHVLEDRLEGPLRLALALLVVIGKTKSCERIRLDGVLSGEVALLLVGDGDHRLEPGSGDFVDLVVDVLAVVDSERPVGLGLLDLGDQLVLEVDGLADVGLGLIEPTGHGGLIRRDVAIGDQPEPVGGGAGLDHHDVDPALGVATTGDGQFEHRLLEVCMGREGDPLALLESHPDSADRAIEGDGAHAESRRGAVQGHYVEGVLLVDGETGDDHLGLTAESVGEGRAKGAVDQTTGQDGLFRGSALTSEERAGDLPCGVHPLFEIDGEREEIDALSHRLVCGGGYQHLGTAESGDHGSVGLSGKFAGAQDELFAADGPLYGDFGH